MWLHRVHQNPAGSGRAQQGGGVCQVSQAGVGLVGCSAWGGRGGLQRCSWLGEGSEITVINVLSVTVCVHRHM